MMLEDFVGMEAGRKLWKRSQSLGVEEVQFDRIEGMRIRYSGAPGVFANGLAFPSSFFATEEDAKSGTDPKRDKLDLTFR